MCSRRFAELGAQVRQLWESPHLPSRDRKRLLATLVEEVVLAVDRSAGRVGVVLRWRGGRTDECELPLPKRGGQQKESASTVELVRRLAALYRDRQIADTLNAQERRTVSGKRFTAKLVASLRQRYGIEGYRRDAREQGQAPLVSVREAAQELGTTAGTLYRWIRQGFLTAEPPVVQGAPMRVRLTAKVRERFCESCPEGFVPAAEARRNMGLSRQSLWQRIREGTLVARRIVRGPEKGLYVQWEESRQLPLLGPADEDEGTEGSA